MPPKLRVSELTQHVKALLESDPVLQDVWVEGEISNFSRSQSGHCYFTLKDEASQLSCVLFRREADGEAARLGRDVAELLREGEHLELRGQVRVYEAQGRYQLYVSQIQPLGEGELYLRFLELKEKLQAEGLFDRPRRPLPQFPARIGLVTSPTAAARQDIQNVLARRYPLARVYLAPTLVQGMEAPLQIVDALHRLYRHRPPMNVILLARGGGSIEELWAFNDERVARMVAAAPVPVVTGVGHETDFTIADFVSDVRAPTPSAAAELATPDRRELRSVIRERRAALAGAVARRLRARRDGLASLSWALQRQSPRSRLVQLRRQVRALRQTAVSTVGHGLRLRRERLDGRRGKLESLSPLAVLDRGYSITRHLPSGRILRDPAGLTPGEALHIRLARGELGARVEARPDAAPDDRRRSPSSKEARAESQSESQPEQMELL